MRFTVSSPGDVSLLLLLYRCSQGNSLFQQAVTKGRVFGLVIYEFLDTTGGPSEISVII